MVKQKNKIEEVAVNESSPVVQAEAPVVKSAVEFPVGEAKGHFYSVAHGEGHVVFNPNGHRVTGIVSLTEASDIVRSQNQAAHIKV